MNTLVFSRSPAALVIAGLTIAALLAQVPTFAADTETAPAVNALNADYAAGQKWVEAKDWTRAVSAFERATLAEPKSADAWNMLGYSRRWTGDLKGAFAAYDRALSIDPAHRGAHNYLGVAYLRSNDLALAKTQLAKLDSLCGKNCTEYQQLATAIASYK
jgi:Flp pilus assembly protein TadD